MGLDAVQNNAAGRRKVGGPERPGAASIDPGPSNDHSAEHVADRLKERIYVAFTALAVVLALRAHGETSTESLLTLVIATVGTLLAVMLADWISHIAVRAGIPTRHEAWKMAQIAGSGSASVVLPVAFLTLASADVWSLDVALNASVVAIVGSLVVIGAIATRRLRLPLWQRTLVWFAEFALGIVVVGLEVAAHG